MRHDGWHAVARSTDITDQPVPVRIAGERWLVARLGRDRERLVAVRDKCPHRGAPLSSGTIEDGCLTCPYHGWRFDADGAVAEIPALGPDASLPRRAHLELAEVAESDGVVQIRPRPRPAPLAIRVLRNDEPALRRGWHPVCRSDELGAVPHTVELLGEPWQLARRGPARTACADRAAGVAEHLGHIWLAPEPPIAELLQIPELGEPGWHHVAVPRYEGRYGIGLLIDNQLDAGHFAFVHRNTFGEARSARVPPYSVERSGAGFQVTMRIPIAARNDCHTTDGAQQLAQHRTMTYVYRAPATLYLRLDYEEMGGSTGILFCFAPLDAERSRLDIDLWFRHPRGFTEAQLAERLAFEQRIFAEDLTLQDQFEFLELPLTLTAELHTRADRAGMAMRRILAELLDDCSAELGRGSFPELYVEAKDRG